MLTVAATKETIALVVFKIISILRMLIMTVEAQKEILIYWKNNFIGSYQERSNLMEMTSLPKEYTENTTDICNIFKSDFLVS